MNCNGGKIVTDYLSNAKIHELKLYSCQTKSIILVCAASWLGTHRSSVKALH